MKRKTTALGFEDPRYERVMKFLTTKGLLYVPNLKNVQRKQRTKLNVSDAIWVGENLEPRVLEVLPAAILHFPSAFADQRKLPADLAAVLTKLRSASPDNFEFRGIPADVIRKWANKPVTDARVKPCDEKKLLRTFRLSRRAITALNDVAAKRGITNTELLEQLLAGIQVSSA